MSRAAVDYLKSRAWHTVPGICDAMHLADVSMEHHRIDMIARGKPSVRVVRRDGVTVYITRGGRRHEQP